VFRIIPRRYNTVRSIEIWPPSTLAQVASLSKGIRDSGDLEYIWGFQESRWRRDASCMIGGVGVAGGSSAKVLWI
jgi:hypothetical protein